MSDNKLSFWNILRILYGGIFIFSGLIKFIDFNQFVSTVSKFKLIDIQYVQTVSYLIPLTEIILGLLLIIKIRPSLISQIIIWMISFFTAVVIAKIFEGEEINCHCFGYLSSGTIDWFTVLRNIILIGFGIALVSHYSTGLSLNDQKMKTKPASNYFEKLKQKNWYYHSQKSMFATIFFFLAVQCLILAMQNHGLKDSISLLMMQNETLQPGDPAKPINTYDLDSNTVKIDFKSNTRTLIYLLSVKCEPCKANMPNWIKLSDALRETGINIIGIAVNDIDEIKEYKNKSKINFRVLSGNNLDFKVNYKAFTTPQTILIDSNGKIIRCYPGILNKVSLDKLFGDLSLPQRDKI